MKVRVKIIGSLGLMILIVSCIMGIFVLFSDLELQREGSSLYASLEKTITDNVRKDLLAQAGNISYCQYTGK